MKSSRAQTRVRFHSIPEIRFEEEQQLTPYSGMVILQALFDRLQFKERIRKAFAHRKAHAIFGHDVIFLCLIVHLVLGYRRLRDTDLYRTDPIVTRVLGRDCWSSGDRRGISRAAEGRGPLTLWGSRFTGRDLGRVDGACT